MVEDNDYFFGLTYNEIMDTGYSMLKYEPEFYDFIEDGKLVETMKKIAEEWNQEIKKNATRGDK